MTPKNKNIEIIEKPLNEIEENLFLGTIAEIEKKVQAMDISHDLFKIAISLHNSYYEDTIEILNDHVIFEIEKGYVYTDMLYSISFYAIGENNVIASEEFDTIAELADFINKNYQPYLPKI